MEKSRDKIAIIVGAGPAGLTAALELLRRTSDIKPIIFEQSDMVGGISRTEKYKGNMIDIGGHRFFSKSDRVLDWWNDILPTENLEDDLIITYHNKSKDIKKSQKEISGDEPAMLVRERSSRIFFLNNFFDYPISLNLNTLMNLGFIRAIKIVISYLKIKFRPIKPEITLEDFYINRFGKVLYELFFMDYTEKVWGVPCNKMTAEWGRQRVKGLSLTKAFADVFQRIFRLKNMRQKKTETSLIQRFLYPKNGPGQMWEETLKKIIEEGGEIFFNCEARSITVDGEKVINVEIFDNKNNKNFEYKSDFVFSTMPIKNLVGGMKGMVPDTVKEVAKGLEYRDFITVGVLIKKVPTSTLCIKDNWIYIQDNSVRVGRIQIFNNWSPYLVVDPDTIWLGMEYFCNEGDNMWVMKDEDFKKMAIKELVKIGFSKEEDVLDSTIIKQRKAYPGYFGTYNQIDVVKNFLNKIENLFLVGRNGMHKYNNQDHSMLTAMVSVDNIINNIKTKDNIWSVNTEDEYHETK